MQVARHRTRALIAALVALLLPTLAAEAQTVVKVALWDKGPEAMEMPDGMLPMGMAMPGAMIDMATMGITVDKAEVPAGEVTFQVLNDTQEFYHSLGIAPVADPAKELPYLADRMMIDEAAAGRVAFVKELRPHDAGAVTVKLLPGTYILYCNIAGHYAMGMWTLITVI
ncbi:MAG: hypothetical protein U1E06_21875 [Tabrizicola sp.]|uniref:hypothetical protein n=1 Tax=Tabrizicola sp. TaxID=2005166 RepID=UPI0027324FE8|nr:hypothetical protein [Tabrizicola sp.]MDP3263219.1 hypothetical protein [Tabrizicola sp.]MDP3646576.1 hypothetical protein [Paracoccaceae bacterium]MDZ4069453.1 hypothetical protein [Tabrizicola sp.]